MAPPGLLLLQFTLHIPSNPFNKPAKLQSLNIACHVLADSPQSERSHSGWQSAAQSSLVGLSTRSTVLMRRGGKGGMERVSWMGKRRDTKEAWQTAEKGVYKEEGGLRGEKVKGSLFCPSHTSMTTLQQIGRHMMAHRQSVNGMD